VHEQLSAYGYEDVESILNEWNPGIQLRGTLEDSANISEMILEMQNTTVDMIMYYDGQVHGSYQGLYNPISYEPFKAYYIFKAFNELYSLRKQAEVTDVPENMSCIAATDGSNFAIMMTNKSETRKIRIEAETKTSFKLYRINDRLNLEFDKELCLNDEFEIEKFETILLISK